MEKFNEIKTLITDLEDDADKFYNKGNSAAGTRVRKGLQDLKDLAQKMRLEIQDKKNKEGQKEAPKTSPAAAPKAAPKKKK